MTAQNQILALCTNSSGNLERSPPDSQSPNFPSPPPPPPPPPTLLSPPHLTADQVCSSPHRTPNIDRCWPATGHIIRRVVCKLLHLEAPFPTVLLGAGPKSASKIVADPSLPHNRMGADNRTAHWESLIMAVAYRRLGLLPPPNHHDVTRPHEALHPQRFTQIHAATVANWSRPTSISRRWTLLPILLRLITSIDSRNTRHTAPKLFSLAHYQLVTCIRSILATLLTTPTRLLSCWPKIDRTFTSSIHKREPASLIYLLDFKVLSVSAFQ